MSRTAAPIVVVAMAFAAPAQAEIAAEGRAYAVLAAGDADEQPLSVRLDAFLDGTWTLANGADVGFSLGLGLERDAPTRDPRGGAVAGAGPVPGPVSGFRGGPAADLGARARVESAFLFVRGGYGEASLGRDEGAAERFSLKPPEPLRTISAFEGVLDPTGVGAPVVTPDLSGRSLKATYASPRLLGLRIGASYTPQVEAEGLDQGFPARAGLQAFAPEDVWEIGLSAARTWRSGLTTAAALTHLRAEPGARGFGDLESWGGGLRVERGPWTLGASGLFVDQGGRGDYGAWGAGVTRAFGETWILGLAAGRADDNVARVSVDTASLAARRAFGPHFAAGPALRRAERRGPGSRLETDSVLIEFAWAT